jgi:hypothetical protein
MANHLRLVNITYWARRMGCFLSKTVTEELAVASADIARAANAKAESLAAAAVSDFLSPAP